MYNSKVPSPDELPSSKQLFKSTVLAAVVASILLVTVVLPAEYGLDPTGIGNVLGLKKMGEIKVSLEAEAKADEAKDASAGKVVEPSAPEAAGAASSAPAPASAPAASTATKNDSFSAVLQPNQGMEVKALMNKGSKIAYKWNTDGGRANFDMHADSKALNIKYHNYEKGSAQEKQGELVAAFEGHHGWFWRNRTPQPLKVTLEVNGDFIELKRME